MANKPRISIFWFRRDLRLADNHGLHEALSSGCPVLPIFIFDRKILDKLDRPVDLRVQFIHESLSEMNRELLKLGSGLSVFYSTPQETFEELLQAYDIESVYTNHDFEPYAIKRDDMISILLKSKGVAFKTYKDHVVFENKEVSKDDGSPYTVFTPYSRKWKSTLISNPIKSYPSESLKSNFLKYKSAEIPTLKSMDFDHVTFTYPSKKVPDATIKEYAQSRDFPSIAGTTKFGIHLRFGTLSIRSLVQYDQGSSETFLNELIWRDFYQMILANFPHVGQGNAFKREYDRIIWRNNEEEFEKWCNGQTGYPIVDAGMRELSATGFMHNRVRMITASFLTKHLLIDWRWGEAWFASKLLDFDLASNNGGWQWAAGSGCDAAPYFRIFNPALQTQRFDKEAKYIRKWVPEFDTLEYAQPIVVHEMARKRCLETYAKYLGKS